MEQWWLLGGDRKPVGPVTTELLLQGIVAGRVPPDTLVCVVGGSEWKAVGEFALFSSVVTEARARSGSEAPTTRRKRGSLLDLEERTIVDGIPLWPAEPVLEAEPETSTLRQQTFGFEDAEERTIVDSPFRPSDPPE
jgi:hypothetical protein